MSKDLGQVLGAEDDQSLIGAREIVEQSTQALERIDKITNTSQNLSQTSGLELLKMVQKVDMPDTKTTATMEKVKPVINAIKTEQDIAIKAQAIATELGTALGVAIVRADEESIKKYEEKLADFKALLDQEAALKNAQLPKDLQDVINASIANSKIIYDKFALFSDIIRKKDAVALQKVMQDLLVEGSSQNTKINIEIVSALKADPDLRAIDSLREEWETFGKTLN